VYSVRAGLMGAYDIMCWIKETTAGYQMFKERAEKLYKRREEKGLCKVMLPRHDKPSTSVN
jgi:hypothetical protein